MKKIVVDITPAAFVVGAIVLAFLGCYGLASFSLVCAFLST